MQWKQPTFSSRHVDMKPAGMAVARAEAKTKCMREQAPPSPTSWAVNSRSSVTDMLDCRTTQSAAASAGQAVADAHAVVRASGGAGDARMDQPRAAAAAAGVVHFSGSVQVSTALQAAMGQAGRREGGSVRSGGRW